MLKGEEPLGVDRMATVHTVDNACLMACKSEDVPPHPSRSRSNDMNKSRAEDMRMSRKFNNWLLDMARAESTLGRCLETYTSMLVKDLYR